MNANEYILQLPHISIKNRELLPGYSGIYYVLDEQFIVWDVGQAKNLRSRWAGDSHHRLYQLQKQRKKQFVIYYELVAESHLNAMERQRIEEYNPQLNGTKIKTKKLHPSNYDRRMTVYVKSFMYGDLRQPGNYSSVILGGKGQVYQLQNVVDCPYKEVYLAAKVDRAFWLLVEPYLSDFTKVKLHEDEGYVNKHYFSARRLVVPAMLSLTLNGKWKTDIPFGSKDRIAYKEVIDIIKNRLQESGIPKLRFSFKSESLRS